MAESKTLAVEIWRGGEDGEFQAYQVPALQSQTVLDVVTWVQRNLDPGLSYRFACRVGMCGSCAMTVNGKPRWTCRSHVSTVAPDGKLRIAPLGNLPVVRDLATDMTRFFEKWQSARGRFEGALSRHDPIVPISPEEDGRRKADEAIECINCGACYAACDVVSWNDDYLGPAALNRAWAAYNDRRDQDPGAVLKAVSSGGGCGNCHSHQSCGEHCPVGLEPTRSIAGLKRATLISMLGGGSDA